MSFTQVPPNSTGNKIDTTIFIDTAGNSVHRQVIAPSDCFKGTATHDGTYRSTLQYAAILSGGSGYVVGEQITLSGGTFSQSAKVEVTSISSGVITKVKIIEIGRYSATTGTLTQASTTGSGTGAQFTATWASDVLVMIDTTGFNYFQFAFFDTWAYASTTLEGSFDDGLNWKSVRWYYGSFGAFSAANGSSGSATSGDIHYCPSLPPLLRVKDSGTNSIGWALRNLSTTSNVVQQGPRGDTNNAWYTKGIITGFGAAGQSGGGGVVFPVVSAASVNNTLVSSYGKALYLLDLFNNGVTPAYLKIYNKSTTPVAGTDVPVAVFGIPSGGKLTIDVDTIGYSLNLSNGVGFAITGAPALLDATAIGAGQVSGTMIFN